jgi:hypothetical protein
MKWFNKLIFSGSLNFDTMGETKTLADNRLL